MAQENPGVWTLHLLWSDFKMFFLCGAVLVVGLLCLLAEGCFI